MGRAKRNEVQGAPGSIQHSGNESPVNGYNGEKSHFSIEVRCHIGGCADAREEESPANFVLVT
jgi:hypothetical protein